MQYLRVGEAFAKFFNATVNISAGDIDFLDDFAVEGRPEVHHPVGGGMLWPDIDDIIIIFKYFDRAFYQIPVGIFHDMGSDIHDLLIYHGEGVVYRVTVIVFTKGKPVPVVRQKETAHIGIVDEPDTEHGVYLPFIEVCRFIHIGNRV
ncbi:hypothetical protein SDC9_173288 [bioreactor metagenome]|uniref:Uncharacterized protein n=1 Tax=bioreactor metagenome TaxID=1076179 RepID=A0A645GI76_9ZZZZ